MSPSPRSWLVLVALVGWTVFVWATRIRNVWEDAALETTEQVLTTLLSVSFLVLAGGVGWAAARLRRDRAPGAGLWFLRLLAGWTLVVWALRIPQILAADHNVPFKAVHTVLGVVSIGLALWTLRIAGQWAAASAPTEGGDRDRTGVLGGTC